MNPLNPFGVGAAVRSAAEFQEAMNRVTIILSPDCARCGHSRSDHADDECWNKDAPPMEFYCECQRFEPKEEGR